MNILFENISGNTFKLIKETEFYHVTEKDNMDSFIKNGIDKTKSGTKYSGARQILESFKDSIIVNELTMASSWEKYSKLSDDEKITLKTLLQGIGDSKTGHKLDRFIKQLWNKHADHNFFKSLVKIHWNDILDDDKDIRKLDNSNELSVEIYKGFPVKKRFMGIYDKNAVGFVLDGRITFASNWNLNSFNSSSEYLLKLSRVTGQKYAGANILKYIIFDKDSFEEGRTLNNEAFIDNWKIKAVVIDSSHENFELKVKMIKERFPSVKILGVDGKEKV